MPRQPQRPPFSETKLRQALAEASCWSDGLRSMGYEPKGHNIRTVQRWARIWEISTDHFDPNIARSRVMRGYGRPRDTIMVENSTYSRGTLKRRLSITSTASRPTSAFVLAAARHSPRGTSGNGTARRSAGAPKLPLATAVFAPRASQGVTVQPGPTARGRRDDEHVRSRPEVRRVGHRCAEMVALVPVGSRPRARYDRRYVIQQRSTAANDTPASAEQLS